MQDISQNSELLFHINNQGRFRFSFTQSIGSKTVNVCLINLFSLIYFTTFIGSLVFFTTYILSTSTYKNIHFESKYQLTEKPKKKELTVASSLHVRTFLCTLSRVHLPRDRHGIRRFTFLKLIFSYYYSLFITIKKTLPQ